MPHYKDGQLAEVGDLVRGRGLGEKDEDGNLKEIVGLVVGLTPDMSSCNIQVAHVIAVPLPAMVSRMPAQEFYRLFTQTGVIGCGPEGGKDGTLKMGACLSLAYGQCNAFELVVGVTVPCSCRENGGAVVQVRPRVTGSQLKAAHGVPGNYRLYRNDEHGGDTPIGDAEVVEVRKMDHFYSVPPATW